MLSTTEIQYLSTLISQKIGTTITFQEQSSIGGGCINQAVCFKTAQGRFFIKQNSHKRYPKMFEKEALGLNLLRESQAIKIPECIVQTTFEEKDFLVLEFIHEGKKADNFWQYFAEALSKLHRTSNENFGLDHDNYIGSLEQINTWKSDWTNFFIEQRLQIQVKHAFDKGLMGKKHLRQLDGLYNELSNGFFPKEVPALLHGDLWNGNFMVQSNGQVALIDPAVYYGHREIELAFTQLFGGFDALFYEAYQAYFPLAKNFEQRVPIYNLYPLLVHVNLFGSSYLSGIDVVLKKF